MSNELQRITEELRSLMEDNLKEDEMIDDFGDVEVENTTLEPVANGLSLTDELDAKARISRALDFLKASIESFKSLTITEIDLIKDSNITNAMENLDQAVSTITSALGGKIGEGIDSQLTLDLETDNKSEEESDDDILEDNEESDEEEIEDKDSDKEESDDDKDEEDEDSDEDEEDETDFDKEAEFDLFK